MITISRYGSIRKDACPVSTQNPEIDSQNKANAVKEANYGGPATGSSSCGNCAAFVQTKAMLQCISTGLPTTDVEKDSLDRGYCTIWDFSCSAKNGCDSWIAGGPVK
jgi:hypothetical protein